MDVPVTLGMTVQFPPSMLRATLFSPQYDIPMPAEVPEKEKETPVLGQVSSEVDGLTRPSSLTACA